MGYRQITIEVFKKALIELGQDPKVFEGKRLPLDKMADLYNLSEDRIMDAVEAKHLAAHYDYQKDTIWVDALEAAYYYYDRCQI